MMLRSVWFAILAVCALEVSCGGGGGGGSNSSSSGMSIAAKVASCEAGRPQLLTAALASNEASVIVDAGPCAYGVPYGSPAGTAPSVFVYGAANIPYTSVTVCIPGTSTCQTIDHVMVDTGSSGLRIMSSVLNPNLVLPPVQLGGPPLVECAQFADGYSWGSVRTADVKIGGPSNTGELASGIDVQVIGDASGYAIPNTCSGTGPALNDVASFGANGILGVGLTVNDCLTNTSCPASNLYYSCPAANACLPTATPGDGSDQVSNPVARFATDYAGVILNLPALTSASGQQNVYGTLVFGLNTNSPAPNTIPATATVYMADGWGDLQSAITSTSAYGYTAETCTNSFIDSGSNGLFIPSGVVPNFPIDANGWFTPVQTVALTALITGALGTGYPSNSSPSIAFNIANTDTVLFAANNGSNTAFNDLGGTATSGSCYTRASGTAGPAYATAGIDWGLPFFFGRPVYVANEFAALTIAGTAYTGPFWAF